MRKKVISLLSAAVILPLVNGVRANPCDDLCPSYLSLCEPPCPPAPRDSVSLPPGECWKMACDLNFLSLFGPDGGVLNIVSGNVVLNGEWRSCENAVVCIDGDADVTINYVRAGDDATKIYTKKAGLGVVCFDDICLFPGSVPGMRYFLRTSTTTAGPMSCTCLS